MEKIIHIFTCNNQKCFIYKNSIGTEGSRNFIEIQIV